MLIGLPSTPLAQNRLLYAAKVRKAALCINFMCVKKNISDEEFNQ
jgi:hypothetical protein